jgi:hypothetical protein
MSEMSLAELKALAAAEDKQEALADAGSELEADEEVAEVEQETEEVETEEAEAETEESDDESETEEWAKPAKGAVPVEKHVEMKHKLKAKLHDANDELERLRAEVEALRKGSVVVQQDQQAPRRPSLSDADIGYDDEKYAERMAQYTDEMIEHKLKSVQSNQAKQSQQQQFEMEIKGAVDKHYERAEALVNKKIVSAENYQAADHIVRKAIEEAIPSMGEVVTDNIIARLGEGSEKVIYHLGINPAALSKLKEAFRSDPTGFAASIYMGELKAKFNSATAEKPERSLRPDKPLSGTAKSSSSALSKYRAAEKSGDVSGMIAAKRLAREKNLDTSNW